MENTFIYQMTGVVVLYGFMLSNKTYRGRCDRIFSESERFQLNLQYSNYEFIIIGGPGSYSGAKRIVPANFQISLKNVFNFLLSSD